MLVRPVLQQVARRPAEVRAPGRPWEDVERLAIVRHDRLGDLVLTLPAIAALRCAYPRAEVALFVGSPLVELAGLFVGVDRVVGVRRDPGDLREQFTRFDADLAVCISRGAGVAWAAWRAAVRHRVGTGHRIYSRLFHRSVAEHRREGRRHEVEYSLAFAHRAGAPSCDAAFPLSVGDGPRAEAAEWLRSRRVRRPFVVLHPGSGGSCPSWPVGHYVGLAERLLARGLGVVLSVGPGDADVGAALDGSPAVAAVPRCGLRLPALAGLLSRAALVIGNSTGPVHLAAALDVPTLAVHAPWPTCGVSRWGPYSERGWGIVADHPAARRWPGRRRRRRAAELMRGLEPDTVLRCAVGILEGGTPRL